MDLSARLAFALIPLGAAAGAVGLAAWLRPQRRGLGRAGEALGLLCLLLSLAAWLVRWRLAAHLPLFGTYESALSLSVVVLASALLARLRVKIPAGLWPVACLAAAGLLAHGLRFDRTAYALTISERSWVVEVHAWLSWAAFGALVANAGLALYRLVARDTGARSCDRWLSLTLSLGFAAHSAMLASGSVYKFLLFGRAWSFDPIETLGFVAWVSYGALLHMHLIAGWTGRRLAGWCLGLFVLLLVSYRGIVYFPASSTYHIFDMDLRIHLTGEEAPPAPEEP